MLNPSITQEILDQLSKLGSEQPPQVLDFARARALKKAMGVPGKALRPFAGTIAAEDLQLMAQTIEEDGEKVNPSEW